MSIEDDAVKLFNEGYNCAESVLLTFLRRWEEYFKLGYTSAAATAFGAGIGRTGHICGALSGALIVVGLAAGRTDPKDEDAKLAVYSSSRELVQHFDKAWGTMNCRELTQCDVSKPEGLARYREQRIHEKKCIPIVRETVSVLKGIIDGMKKDP